MEVGWHEEGPRRDRGGTEEGQRRDRGGTAVNNTTQIDSLIGAYVPCGLRALRGDCGIKGKDE